MGTLLGNTSFNNLTFLTTDTYSLASSGSFVVGGLFTCSGGGGNLVVLNATTSGQRALLTLDGTQNVFFTDATDIDSSKGNAVVNSEGTISNTVNWTAPESGGGVTKFSAFIQFFDD